MIWYIIFCYFVAISSLLYYIQTAKNTEWNEGTAGILAIMTLAAPLTVTLAFIILPIWYLIKFLRNRKILP